MELKSPEIAAAGPGWVSRIVEALQPVSVRADRLGSLGLFAESALTSSTRPVASLRPWWSEARA